MQARIFKHSIHIKNERMYRGIETQGHGFYSSVFIHFSFPILHVNMKNFVRVFSGTVLARILKNGIHMDNE